MRYKNTVALVKGHYQGLPGDGTENSAAAGYFYQLVAVTSKTMVPIKKCICQICTFIVGKHYFSFGTMRESKHSFTSLHSDHSITMKQELNFYLKTIVESQLKKYPEFSSK